MTAAAITIACAVCGVGLEESRLAFILTTIFLSLLPLTMIGGTLLWLRRRAHALAQGEQA